MKINIIGDGSFGTFLKQELPKYGFEILPLSFPLPVKSQAVILAVPFSSYENIIRDICWQAMPQQLIINVCSIQQLSTEILLKYTDRVTSIHPLFGARTPADKRNSIITYRNFKEEESEFLSKFVKFSKIISVMPKSLYDGTKQLFTPDSHDCLMARTHAAAVLAAKQAKHFVDAAADIPDELLPNSFRLLKQFVQTLEDMPPGTVSSIMANPYI